MLYQTKLWRNFQPSKETVPSLLLLTYKLSPNVSSVGLETFLSQQHDDVYMKLFALSLEGDAYDWYTGLDDNSYATYAEFLKGFKERLGDKKEPRHQLASLHTIKRSENETMEFNKKFREVVKSIHFDFKPPDKSILVYYMEALSGELRYQLRDKEPGDLKKDQELVVKIDQNMQALGKSNIPGYIRALIPPKQQETKAKDPMNQMQEAYDKNIKDMNEKMGALQTDYANQMKNMQN